MDAPKASYSIALTANILGVTSACYDAWKGRATQQGKRAPTRRWEPGSTRRKDTTALLSEASSAASSEASPTGSHQAG